MAGQKLLDVSSFGRPEPHLEQAGLLLQKPFSKFFIPAVGESAYEVRNVVVLAVFIVVFMTWLFIGTFPVLCAHSSPLAFEGHLSLVGILVDGL